VSYASCTRRARRISSSCFPASRRPVDPGFARRVVPGPFALGRQLLGDQGTLCPGDPGRRDRARLDRATGQENGGVSCFIVSRCRVGLLRDRDFTILAASSASSIHDPRGTHRERPRYSYSCRPFAYRQGHRRTTKMHLRPRRGLDKPGSACDEGDPPKTPSRLLTASACVAATREPSPSIGVEDAWQRVMTSSRSTGSFLAEFIVWLSFDFRDLRGRYSAQTLGRLRFTDLVARTVVHPVVVKPPASAQLLAKCGQVTPDPAPNSSSRRTRSCAFLRRSRAVPDLSRR
jgi:hypothetical protein